MAMSTRQIYKNKYPSVGEIVIGKNKQVTDLGVYLELLEYECDGLIVIGELSKKRIKNIQKSVKIGKLEVCSVLRVDIEKGYIDLSRKNITLSDFESCYDKYLKNKKADNVMISTAKKFKKKPIELYEEFGWEMSEKYGNIYNFLVALKNDRSIFESEYTDTLVKFVETKFKPPILKIKAFIDITCPTENGIDSIKNSLENALSICKDIKINLVRHPTFALTLFSDNKDEAIKILNEACSTIKNSIIKYNGIYTRLSEPRVYGERNIVKNIMNDYDDLSDDLDKD